MFRLSKLSFHSQILLTIIIVICLWIPAFIQIQPFTSPDGSIFNFFFWWISKVPFIGVIINFSVFIIASIYLYKILTSSHLQTPSSFVPELILLIFISNISNMQLNSITISGLFLLFSISALFKIKDGNNDGYIFFSSFLIGIATIFNPAIWLCMFLPIIAILIFETISIRKILLSILGFLLIWLWAVAIAFILDTHDLFIEFIKGSIYFTKFQFPLLDSWHSWSLFILETVLIIPIIFLLFVRSHSDVIVNRRRIFITIIFFVLLFFSCFFTSINMIQQRQLLFIPEIILIAYLYEQFKNNKLIYSAGVILFLIFVLNLYERWIILF